MDQLRTKRGFVRTAITKALSTLDALLADSTTPTGRLQEILDLIVVKNAQLVHFDSEIQAALHDDELEADLTTAYEYEEKVSYAQTRVRRATAPRPPTPPASVPVTASPTSVTSGPPDLSILYRQRQKEALLAENADASQGAQSQQVKDLMNFIRVQIEMREESGLEEATWSTSRQHPQREFRPPQPPLLSAAALSAEVRPPYSRPCLLCNSPEHTIQECSERITPEDKRRRLQVDKLCFRCAKRNHFANDCRTSRFLRCHQCTGRHLTSLCDINNVRNRSQRAGNASAPQDRALGSATNPSRATSVSTSGAGLTPVLLQTGRAWAIAPEKTVLGRFLLDTGSQRSFVRQDIARALKCPVRGTERLTLFTFGKTQRPATLTCERVAVTLRSQHSSNETTIEALAIPEISPVTSPPADGELVTMMTRQGMLPADARPEATTFREDEISVLIESDIYWDVATGQITRLSPQLTAAETLFGWTIQGTLSNLAQGSRTRATSLFIAVEEATESDTALDMRIANLWCIDSLGVQDSPDSSQSDSIALEVFENDVSKKVERYEVPLLLREPGLETGQSNYDLAKQRLLMQLRRFRQQPDLLVGYDDNIKAYFNESHAEQVPDNDTVPKPNGVIRRDAVTTKLRVVFDASSHAPGQPSLNNVLMKGPKMDADLLKLLFNFMPGIMSLRHPIMIPGGDASTAVNLRRRVQHRQALTDHLWKRWRKEYLLLLRSAHEAAPKTPPRLQVGDIVMVHDDSPPITWKMARVTELLPGRDNIARACCLRLASGSIIRRPVQKVYLLEAGSTS
ncbi:hypothetical protein HPB52_006522 [Rhipicephalus sanguineus]|uniref:CCHC-type domain-containing protein n=1 Tax=Rhipicephalus sanguineus TaxID=34632 RepID=A0A9D4SQA3_RHISA|nr:hypothetical protein HPB52_006522 [Rhipicephalus sanguineus]